MTVNEVIEFMECEMGIEDVELIEQHEGLRFTGVIDGEEAEIKLTKTNEVIINGHEKEMYLPFNVWSVN